MKIAELLNDKTKKVKEKVEAVSKWLLAESIPIDGHIAFSEKSKDTGKATCIKAIEFATRQNSSIAKQLRTLQNFNQLYIYC
jgi:hypothetical protein